MVTNTEYIDLTPEPEAWPQLKSALEYAVATHKLNIVTLTQFIEEDLPIDVPYIILEALENEIGETVKAIAELEAELTQPWALSVKGK